MTVLHSSKTSQTLFHESSNATEDAGVNQYLLEGKHWDRKEVNIYDKKSD